MPNFLGNTLLEISEITNIETYSVKPNKVSPLLEPRYLARERIEALDEQTQLEQLLNMINLERIRIIKDTVI
jgi:hypothetical protein